MVVGGVRQNPHSQSIQSLQTHKAIEVQNQIYQTAGCKQHPNLEVEDVDNTSNPKHRMSVASNVVSERTVTLKKEINSLDDEILNLQNSLKEALMKKS
jgi:hypothetical protein